MKSPRRHGAFTLVELPAVSGRRRAAFTLVELLVVIGIIALLISILLPTLSRAREAGNRVACASNLRQLGIAFEMYLNEHKGTYPPAWFHDDLTVSGYGGQPGRNISWATLLRQYTGVSNTSTLKISSRPSSMASEQIQVWKSVRPW